MAFDAGSIVAKMRLNTKEFTTSLQATQKEVGAFDRTAGRLLSGGLVAGGLALLARRLTSAAVEGGKFGEISLAFDRVAGSAENANAILQGTRKATADLANIEIKQLANRLDLVGVEASNLPRLAEIAEAIGDSTGESTKQILESIVSGTARASDRMLALIGLNIDLEKATEDYAKSVGLTVKELSEEQKQMVFVNELMREGDDIIGRLGNTQETSADKIAKATTAWKNYFDELKRGFADAVAPMAAWLATPVNQGMSDIQAAKMLGSQLPKNSLAQQFENFAGGSSRIPTAQLQARQNQVAAAAVAAQVAAKAFFNSLITNGRTMPGGFVGPPSGRLFGERGADIMNGLGSTGLDLAEITDPGLINPAFDSIKQGLVDIGGLVSGLGDSFSSLFEEIVSGSGMAGRAFFSNMMAGLGSFASNLGDVFIQMGVGFLAFAALNPFAAIGAGLVLKALAGALRGVANKNAPAFSTATVPTRPRGDDFDNERGRGTTIIVDNFIGNKAWMQDFIRMLNGVQRNTGARVEIHGAA